MQGSLEMNWTPWYIKEDVLGFCRCQRSKEKFRAYGMGWGKKLDSDGGQP